MKKNIIKSRQDFLDLSRLEKKGETLKERLIRTNNEKETKEKELNSKFNLKDYFSNITGKIMGLGKKKVNLDLENVERKIKFLFK